jgi:DNA polymerase-1
MNRLHDEMKARGMKSKMLLQVHDELMFEVPASELKDLRVLVCETMEGAMTLSVPLKVEVKYGMNWGEMQGME